MCAALHRGGSVPRVATQLTDAHRKTITALCDTIVPSIERQPDPDGFFALRASDVGADVGLADLIEGLPPEQFDGITQLLEALEEQGFGYASQLSREQILRNIALLGPEAAGGVGALVGGALFLTYTTPDPATGRTPAWAAFGYPGPIGVPRSAPKPIEPLVPDGDELELEADVVIVGSGAGGGVIAGTLAQQGLKVVVLEAAGYFNEGDFKQLELVAYQEMYWRGGPTPSADGNFSLQAGTTRGGGTTINWTNCLRTYPWVREQWASEYGLEAVDGADYDAHLDAVLTRISATDKASDLNGPQEKMKEGCERLGWDFRPVVRNVDLDKYSPEASGYLGFGDPSGAKQSTAETYLRDAF